MRCAQKLRQFLIRFCVKIWLSKNAHGILVAKDHDLPGILDCVISASVKFRFEPSAPNIAFHIRQPPPHDAALTRRFGRKEVQEPAFGAEISVGPSHAHDLPPIRLTIPEPLKNKDPNG